MNNLKPIHDRYIKVQCGDNVELYSLLKKYINKIESEKHRHYHTLDHVFSVFHRLGHSINSLLFAICHDIVYNPRSKTNEEDSIEYITNELSELISADDFINLCNQIIETKDISKVTYYNEADRYDVLGELPKLINYFELIRKEFDCYYYKDFIKAHCDVIMKIRKAHNVDNNVTIEYLKHVRKYKPTVAIYTGSFNPFHIGHYGVMLEAEKIFDKVIIAKLYNIDKDVTIRVTEFDIWNDVPSTIYNKETVIYPGTIFQLFDHYSKLYEKITFIKGVRNSKDIEYDMQQYRVIRDINPNINFMFIPSTPGTEYISSSMIRNLKTLSIPTDRYEL